MKHGGYIRILLAAVVLSLCSCDLGSNAGHVTINDLTGGSSPFEEMFRNGEITSPTDPIPLTLTFNIENTYRKNIEIGNAAFTLSDKNGKELVAALFTAPILIPKSATSDVPVEMEVQLKHPMKIFSLVLAHGGNPDKLLSKVFITGSFTAKAGILKRRYSVEMMPLDNFVGHVFELNEEGNDNLELQPF